MIVLSVGTNAQTNEFTYQGRLSDAAGTAASYDFQFALCIASSGGILLGTRERLGVPVSNGAFSVTLDFPSANFTGFDRWLEIRVKPAGSVNPYTVLSPRQQIISSPYSIRSLVSTMADLATNATNATNANDANLLNGFSTVTTFTAGRRIYVSGTSGYSPFGTVNSATIVQTDVGANNLNFAAAIGSGSVVSASNTIALGRTSGADRVRIYGRLAINTFAAATSTNLCINALTDDVAACSSSIRFKTNISTYNTGLSYVNQLRPVTFDWKESMENDLGLIAEEVAEVEPLLVTRNKTDEIQGVKYDRIGVVLLNAVKEQQTQIENQADQIQKQQTQIEAQMKQIERQNAVISGLKKLVCAQNPQEEICQEEK